MIIAVYEKLVRDRIPDIIQAKGKDCRFSRVSGEQLKSGLEAKLSEEIQEFIDSGRDLEELADILGSGWPGKSSGIVFRGNHEAQTEKAKRERGIPRRDLVGVGSGLD